AADAAAREIAAAHPDRAVAMPVDVRDDASLARLIRRTVVEFGGLYCLFYTACQVPRFAGVTDIGREDLQRQLDVHYLGAVLALGAAAGVMRRQKTGVSIVATVSKSSLTPTAATVANAGSKPGRL